MGVLGLIAEYNPFHNGHMYHLLRSKKITGADYTVAVMSGNWVQRGEPSIINKWARTKIALNSGIDLVIELPAVYSSQTAEIFACGAINLLDKTGIIDFICFGSEEGSLDRLYKAADILLNENDEFSSILNKYLKCGHSFAASRLMALNKFLGADFARLPNNILAIEYIKNLNRLNSRIRPYTIKRLKSQNESILSSSEIRDNLINDAADIKYTVPKHCFNILNEEIASGRGPMTLKKFENLIIYNILKESAENLTELFDVNEGLENRIKKAAQKSADLESLLNNIKTKRYTMTRIKRILTNLLININRNDVLYYKQNGPSYICILGFNQKGRELISEMKKSSSLPIITNINKLSTCGVDVKRLLEIETFATQIYALGYVNKEQRFTLSDFRQPPVFVRI